MFGFDYVQRAEKVRRPCNYWKRIHLNAGVSEYWVLAEAKATGLKAKRLLYFLQMDKWKQTLHMFVCFAERNADLNKLHAHISQSHFDLQRRPSVLCQ